ncbi:MAG TPA: PAS domain S-box protein [Planctomycetaceae bacterium]|jgi:PAS domain S-box-containing protein|nr:PAS domain S-box protein [Planctomycetaceae bacterium]
MSILDDLGPASKHLKPADWSKVSTGENGAARACDSDFAGMRDLVESLEQVLFLISADWSRAFYVSPAYERVTGYSRESLFTDLKGWTQLVHPEDREIVRETVGDRASGLIRGRVEMEYRIVTASGEIRWMRSVVSQIKGPEGEPDRLVGLADDITERKLAEIELKRSEAQLAQNVHLRTVELSRTVENLEREIEQRKQAEAALERTNVRVRRLFEANLIGVIFSDLHGAINDANDAFLEMTGYSRADLPLRWDTMTPPEWAQVSEQVREKMKREGRVPPWEKEYIRKDGSRVPVFMAGALLESDGDQCVFFVVDLTKLKNAEEQVRDVRSRLDHASRLSVMGELLADMAHEIHQPLGVIANYANGSLKRLKKGQLTVGALKDKLREIAAESMRVAEVLRRIREFIRRREPERELVNLNTIVADALQFTRLERRQHRISVILRPDRDLRPVEADGVQITQVLINLLSNAVHSLSDSQIEAPKITISTHMKSDGNAEVVVADNGPGISAADLPRIFDRFFTTKARGLGLGLPISRSIVESCGGQLCCDSQPGEPAVFRLTLPTATPGAETTTAPSSP